MFSPPIARATTCCTSQVDRPKRAGPNTVDLHLDVAPARTRSAYAESRTRHRLDDLPRPARRAARSPVRSGPATLMPTGLLMPVESMSMRLRIGWHPEVGEPRDLRCGIHLLDQLILASCRSRHSTRGLNWIVVSNISRPPGRSRSRRGPPCRRPLDFRKSHQDLVGLLQQLRCLVGGQIPGSAVGM